MVELTLYTRFDQIGSDEVWLNCCDSDLDGGESSVGVDSGSRDFQVEVFRAFSGLKACSGGLKH